MNIYLIRHGESEQTSEGKPHEERALTANGIEIIKSSIELWKKFIDTLDIVLTSPLKRAKQTANIIGNTYKTQFDVTEEICLLNGGLTEDLLSIARSLDLNDIAMVGHQPDLGIHISRMIGSNNTNFNIPPALIAKIIFKERPVIGKGVLEFLLP
ncbi:MAG: histidine phosphatase family protein, partial [Ignavibacteriaceae bacterium]|nr:histidine phosphatase family protein [Ignavibacteriaceae bacterium]